MARLKAEASTTAGPGMRQVYETALGKQILNLYRADKDLFGEIKVLRDEECVDAMRPPTRDAAVQWCHECRVSHHVTDLGWVQGCQMANFDPFLSLDCARVEGVRAQSK